MLKDLCGFIDDGKKKLGMGVVVFVVVNEGCVFFVVGVIVDFVDKVNVVDLVKVGVVVFGGKGGGGCFDMV